MMLGNHDVFETQSASQQDFSKSLGRRLRQCRKERGLTMMALGSIAQCSQSFLSKVEGGDITPSLPMLQRLSRALGVKPSFLVEGSLLESAMSYDIR